MEISNGISAAALLVSLIALAFSVYAFRQSKVARLQFRMSINRSYASNNVEVPDGTMRPRITGEHNPTTRLLIRNLSHRPTAITRIRAKNPSDSILLDVNQQKPGGRMPLKIEPWGVEIIETTWPAGEHTEGLYFEIADIDDHVYRVHDYTENRRLSIGDDPLREFAKRRRGV